MLLLIRSGAPMTLRQQLYLTVQLSIPSILAQLSSIAMQYIDASMVGSLGASASASIGLVSTTTWLFMGLCSSASTGFAVQVAHLLGAKDIAGARSVLRQALAVTLTFSLVLAAAGACISGSLPHWLGGNADITGDASIYFLVFVLSMPVFQLNVLASAMLRSSGNMTTPSSLNILMCILDVVFNYFLIFPTREISLMGTTFTMPGAGLEVTGAALGTALAMVCTASLMLYSLCARSPELSLLHRGERFRLTSSCLRNALRIGLPMGCERVVMCGAQQRRACAICLATVCPTRLPLL